MSSDRLEGIARRNRRTLLRSALLALAVGLPLQVYAGLRLDLAGTSFLAAGVTLLGYWFAARR
jgi:hypothetical protein